MAKQRSIQAPKKTAPERGRISLLVPGDVRRRLIELAQRERRTLNGQVEVMLVRALEAEAA